MKRILKIEVEHTGQHSHPELWVPFGSPMSKSCISVFLVKSIQYYRLALGDWKYKSNHDVWRSCFTENDLGIKVALIIHNDVSLSIFVEKQVGSFFYPFHLLTNHIRWHSSSKNKKILTKLKIRLTGLWGYLYQVARICNPVKENPFSLTLPSPS